ncbi:MAG: hypothetical protein CMB30_00715 [Euryarchaeota archaeon]|nr:hypothetical protein [Euryarchaeota archaeon]
MEDLKSLIGPNFALINPKVVCGKLHLQQAAYLSASAHQGNYNLANDKSTEVLLYLTAQRQISKAIKIGGIDNTIESLAWVSFGETPKKLFELVKKDESVIDISNFDSSGFNSEIGIDKIQKIVMTKTATLSVQSR